MELIYRGIKYQSDKSEFHDFNNYQHGDWTCSHSRVNAFGRRVPHNEKLLLIWQKKKSKASTDKFPLAKYCQQLFSQQTPKAFSLTKFWHQHQRDRLEICWQIDVIENLNHCWRTTVIVELKQKITVRTPIKLKYRGVTYYQ
jgi:hypothetical protein